MNPLVQSCLEITKAGYRKDDAWKPQYRSEELRSLGIYLLNNSATGRTDSYRLPYIHEQVHAYYPAIMYGGGIDSYCAMVASKSRDENPVGIVVNYGQPYAEAELEAAIRASKEWNFPLAFEHCPMIEAEQINQLDLSWENYIIPARNLVLAAIGANYSKTVYINATKRSDESVGTPDKTSRFYTQASKVFTEFYNTPYIVHSPFRSSSKLDMVKWCYENIEGFNYRNMFDNTFSCYSPVEKTHCGTCYACYKRYQLAQALDFPIDFATHPINGKNYDQYQAKEAAKGR